MYTAWGRKGGITTCLCSRTSCQTYKSFAFFYFNWQFISWQKKVESVHQVFFAKKNTEEKERWQFSPWVTRLLLVAQGNKHLSLIPVLAFHSYSVAKKNVGMSQHAFLFLFSGWIDFCGRSFFFLPFLCVRFFPAADCFFPISLELKRIKLGAWTTK